MSVASFCALDIFEQSFQKAGRLFDIGSLLRRLSKVVNGCVPVDKELVNGFPHVAVVQVLVLRLVGTEQTAPRRPSLDGKYLVTGIGKEVVSAEQHDVKSQLRFIEVAVVKSDRQSKFLCQSKISTENIGLLTKRLCVPDAE